MMNLRRYSRLFVLMMCTILLVLQIPCTAHADTGPKPSVHILFENMGDQLCYGTLLSQQESTGPSSVWDGHEGSARHSGNYSYETIDYDSWKAFVEYKDSDGYYYLQESWLVSETKEIAWTYYPPYSFKILLYYPETETFVVSGIYERYAFDTYYTVDMDGIEIGSVDPDTQSTDARIDAYRSYNYSVEILSLIARIIITIAIEMAVALLFGFRGKQQLLLLIAVNTATQIILNVLLNLTNYTSGPRHFVINYILLEIIVFVLEALLYCHLMKKRSEAPKRNRFYVLYSLVANVASFAIGLWIATVLPGIF